MLEILEWELRLRSGMDFDVVLQTTLVRLHALANTVLFATSGDEDPAPLLDTVLGKGNVNDLAWHLDTPETW